MKRYSSLGLALVMAFSAPMPAFADGTGPSMPACMRRGAPDLREKWERNDSFVRNFVRDWEEPDKGSRRDPNALCRELRAALDERQRTAATDCGDCRRAPEPRTVEVEDQRRVVREVVRPAPIREQAYEGGGGLGEFFSNPLVTGVLGFGGGLLLGNLLFKDRGRQPTYMHPPMYGPPLRPPGLLAPPILPYPGFSRPLPIFAGGGGFGGMQPGFGGGFQPGFGGGFQPGFGGGFQPGFGFGGGYGGGYQSPIGPGYNFVHPGAGGGYGFIQQPQFGLMNPNAPAILPFPGPGVMRTFSNSAR